MLKYFLTPLIISIILPISVQADMVNNFWCNFAQEINSECILSQIDTLDSDIGKGFDSIAEASIEDELLPEESPLEEPKDAELDKPLIISDTIVDTHQTGEAVVLTNFDKTGSTNTNISKDIKDIAQIPTLPETSELELITDVTIDSDNSKDISGIIDNISKTPEKALTEEEVSKISEENIAELAEDKPELADSEKLPAYVEIEPTFIPTPPLAQLPTCPASGTINWICTFNAIA